MAYSTPVVVVPSAARIATGNSGPLTVQEPGEDLSALLDVTAVAGTGPNLVLSVEWSHDGVAFGAVDTTADAFAAITAATTKVKSFTVKGPFYRFVWTITGTTPSFTFSIRTYVTS